MSSIIAMLQLLPFIIAILVELQYKIAIVVPLADPAIGSITRPMEGVVVFRALDSNSRPQFSIDHALHNFEDSQFGGEIVDIPDMLTGRTVFRCVYDSFTHHFSSASICFKNTFNRCN